MKYRQWLLLHIFITITLSAVLDRITIPAIMLWITLMILTIVEAIESRN